MEKESIDALILSPGSDMLYFTGFWDEPMERLELAFLPRDLDPLFVVPTMYREHVAEHSWIKDIRTWSDSEDPTVLLKNVVRELKIEKAKVALDTKMWSRFFLMLLQCAPHAKYSDASEVTSAVRSVKDAEEIQVLEKAFVNTERVMAKVIEESRAGMYEKDLQDLIERELRANGSEGVSFKPIVTSGPRGAMPHLRGGDKKIEKGEGVILDFGGIFNGYATDVTRTVFIEHCSPEMKKVYEIVKEANQRTFDSARPGIPAQEMDRTARGLLKSEGYGEYFSHRIGHGLGMDVHEDPYLTEGNTDPLQAGNVFSIEPGIYLPGRFGVRIEDIVVLEQSGARRFTNYTREIVIK